ncbi:hypothetical protein, partial [Marinomonas rhizomae]|uniref:hypothetical protein n=1 Tax=Marinomonas rhizomae TaxID=491948 RepID=UPI0019D44E84
TRPQKHAARRRITVMPPSSGLQNVMKSLTTLPNTNHPSPDSGRASLIRPTKTVTKSPTTLPNINHPTPDSGRASLIRPTKTVTKSPTTLPNTTHPSPNETSELVMVNIVVFC